MSLRAVALGLLGVAVVNGFTYFNDHIIRQTFFVINHMPISVYGGLILFVLLVNPLLFRLGRRWGLASKEIIVAMTITLASCGIPGSSLMRNFTNSLNLPHHYNVTETGWKEAKVLERVPPQLLTDPGTDDDTVVSGFFRGLREGDEHISVGDVPWRAWARPLAYWIPLLLTLWFCLIGLSLVTHGQWAENEQLPYPIARLANSLLPEEDGRRSRIFSNRNFWIGAGIVFAIHMNNYLYHHWPQYMIRIPLQFNLAPLARLSEVFSRGGGVALFYEIHFYFTVIGVAYFLASDVSCALGIGPVLWRFVAGAFAIYGVSMAADVGGKGASRQVFLQWGSYMGALLSMLYVGRYHYVSVLRRAFLLPARQRVPRDAVWGARAAMVFFVAFIAQLGRGGIDWQIGLVYAGALITIFVVMSRILAETGLFFILPQIYPCAFVLGLFGARALGPSTIAIIYLLTLVVVIDPRETLMPFIVNAYKSLDLQGVSRGRATGWFVGAILLGLAIAVPVTLYLQYDNGTDKADHWHRTGPLIPFTGALQAEKKLEAFDQLEESERLSGWGRIAAIEPNRSCLIAMVAGLVLVLGCSALRLRSPKWPIHPLMFLIWWSWGNMKLYFSFLVGWGIKIVVLKVGGERLYRELKPLMIGIVAGEIVAALIPMIVGAISYFITGTPPQTFHILVS